MKMLRLGQTLVLLGLFLGYGVTFLQKKVDARLEIVEKAAQQKLRIFETRMRALPTDRDLLQALEWGLAPAIQSQLSRHLFRSELDVLSIGKKGDEGKVYEAFLQDIKNEMKDLPLKTIASGRGALLSVQASGDAFGGISLPLTGDFFLEGFVRLDHAWLVGVAEMPSFLRMLGVSVLVTPELQAELTFRQPQLTSFAASFRKVPLPSETFWAGLLLLCGIFFLRTWALRVAEKNKTIRSLQKSLESLEWEDKRSREANLSAAQRLRILEGEFEELQIEKVKLLEEREKHFKLQALYEQMGRAQHVLYQKFLRWLELLDETLDIVSEGLTAEAKKLKDFHGRWRQGVLDHAGGQLGVRKYFKQLSESVDATTGKTHLEGDLDFLAERAEAISDDAVNLALKISALKGGSILNIQLFEHWNQLFLGKVEQKPVELINVYRTLNHLLSVDQTFSAIDLLPPQIFGRGPVSLPVLSESVFASLCYHALLSILFETAASTGKRSLKLILKSTPTAGELIVQCHVGSGLRVQRDNGEAMRHWDLAYTLGSSCNIQLNRQAPTLETSSLSLSWENAVQNSVEKPKAPAVLAEIAPTL